VSRLIGRHSRRRGVLTSVGSETRCAADLQRSAVRPPRILPRKATPPSVSETLAFGTLLGTWCGCDRCVNGGLSGVSRLASVPSHRGWNDLK
jgi:hypothetical protein